MSFNSLLECEPCIHMILGSLSVGFIICLILCCFGKIRRERYRVKPTLQRGSAGTCVLVEEINPLRTEKIVRII